MDARKICLLISEGKISEAKNSIISYNGEVLDSKVALPILITLCRTVSQIDSTNSISANDTFQLTIICCKNLSGLIDTDKDNFLLAVYHVTKYLCKHKLYDDVLILLDFIKQQCINENFKSDVYNFYVCLFHNQILQNASDLTGNIILEIVSYSLQFQILLKKQDFSSMIQKFKSYPSLFKSPNISNTYRTKFCTEILNIFENLPASENQSDVKQTYSVLLKIVTVIIQCLARCEDEHFPYLVNEQFKQTCSVMRKHCKSKEYVDCIDIIEGLTNTVVKNLKSRSESDLNILTECGKQLKAVIRKRGSNPIVIVSCSLVAKILRTLFEYLQNCKELWVDYFSIEMQTELLRMVEVLGQFISKNAVETDQCCRDCKLKTDIYHATIITSCTGILTNISLRLNMSYSEVYHVLSLRCLKMSCKFINQLKEEGCGKYDTMWRIVGTAAYNTSVILYRNNYYKFAKLYVHLIITNVISLEGVDNPELCFQNSLGAALHLYGTCCSFLQEREEALLYFCLTLLFSPEYKKKALNSWIMLKSIVDDADTIKSVTVYDLLFDKQESIKEIYPDYTYNQKVVEDLLMDELLFYFENWQSRIAMKCVCNIICKISKNEIYRTRCFVLTWEKIVYILDDDYIKNLEATIEMMKSTTNINLKMCLSVLHYIQYQARMYKIVDSNIADMNEANIPLKNSPLQPYEEPPNPNDKCDIVPAFYNMKIDNLFKVYKILDLSFEIWDDVLQDKYKLDPNVVSNIQLGNFIKLTAYEYRMQHFNIKMINTWIIYYKFLKQFNCKTEIVTSIGFIIEYSDCKSEIVKFLQQEAEDLLIDFNLKDPQQLETYLTYYINKSSGCLKNDMIELGYSALCTAEKYLDEAIGPKLKICEARILHLKTCYLMLPCSNKIITHEDNFLITAQNSFNIIAEYYTTKISKCPYLISILFEISLANGWMYKWLRLPREVRCYSKETITFAQKCLLPIRTAQFLSLLAFTDLLDMQYSDCEVKLNGLTKMLSYASHEIYEKLPIQAETFEDLKLESPECELSELDNSIPMIQTVLDIPASMRKTNNIMSSPELRRKSFVLPEFIKHSKDCDCFMCSNCEYQKLILDSIHLEALLNLYQGVSEQGEDYFKGGLTLYDKLRKKSKLFSYKPLRFSEKEVIYVNLYKNISQSYCTFLLDYSYFLAKRGAFNDAKKVVNNVFKLLCNVKHVNSYFWSELMIQKLNLCFEDEINEEKIKDENTLEIPVDSSQSKTPKSKMSKSNIYLTVTPAETSRPVKTFKKLTFDLSEDEKDVKDVPKTPETNKNQSFKFQIPAKTPAPVAPKIKIYTPKTVKPKRTTSKSITASTPGNLEMKKCVNKQLEERTKLLTEKLKAEKKPVLKDCSNIDNLNNKLSKEVTTVNSSVRKKLLDDLDDVTESVEKLSINLKGKSTTKVKQLQNFKKTATSNEKTVEVKQKKYTRIKEPSSSSDSSSDCIGIRKSTRARKT